MSKIPVIVVDDETIDRYIVKRQLAKCDDFEQVLEVATGGEFLEAYFSEPRLTTQQSKPLLVLMDINMPQMSGFETIEELQRRMDVDSGPDSVVILMFTSSNNPEDRAKAESLPTVKGYVVKPLDEGGVETIRELYYA
ncbi:response regulator [Phaeobacter sp. B1627]|uniref:response regulator n=1 Tax=Phaeobacter sp. B1627 TaxID=2583809 RepID=UPI00159EC1A9|nr:response regulator [Phaeobacter sp. B1627]